MVQQRELGERRATWGHWLVGLGWLLVAGGLVAAFVPSIGGLLSFVSVPGLLGVSLGCWLVLRALGKNWAHVAYFGVVFALWTLIGLLVSSEARGMQTQSCQVTSVTRESEGEFSKISYRYGVTCPSGVHEILDAPARKQNEPATVYSPGRRVDVAYDPDGRRAARFDGGASPNFMLIPGPVGGAVLTSVTLLAGRRRRGAALTGRLLAFANRSGWGWGLIAAGWLVLPGGVLLLGVLALPRAVAVPVMAIGMGCLLCGAVVAGGGDRGVLLPKLGFALFMTAFFTFATYEAAEKLRLAVHGREYTCEVALKRTIQASPPVTVHGNFVLCPNGSYAKMTKSFGLSDVGDRVQVLWDPERRQRATLSGDLETGDLIKELGRVPLLMAAAPAVAWLMRRFGDPFASVWRRPTASAAADR